METPLRILIVEDSEDDALLLLRELKKGNFAPEWERVDTPDAMKTALAEKEWDIVTSDFSMPCFSGLDALRLLKESELEIPFLIVSGKIGEEIAVELMKAGAQDYILKGNLARLVPAIKREVAEVHVRRKRRDTEIALWESEEKLRIIAETAVDAIVMTDNEGAVAYWNQAAERIFGYSRQEIMGKELHPLIAPTRFQDAYTEGLGKFRKSGKGPAIGTTHEYVAIKKDGTEIPVEVSLSAFRLKGKWNSIGILRDISERKTLESQLFQAQKMEAIGQLAGGIAHDFNNILTAIIGFSTIMEMKMEENDPQRENVNHILASADRAADLTRSLLTFSRKQVINPQPVDLNQIIQKIEKFIQRIIGEDIELTTKFHPDILTVKADSGQIEQVLMNMATNARDAMPKGGMLSIVTKHMEMGADFIKTHGYGQAGEYALLTISDNGTGMSETTRKKLFEPFFTTKEVGKGTGLGLSIVYGIVKQHNGFINVYSVQGVGTTFNIYLPITKATAAEKANIADEILERGTETILVADDDAALRDLSKHILGQFGYTVITAEDGLDAINKFRENKDKINLLILDVIMPGTNGKEAYDEIIKIRPDVKSIFISGYTAEIIHKRGVLDESMEFVTKPLRPAQLLKKVREVLNRKG